MAFPISAKGACKYTLLGANRDGNHRTLRVDPDKLTEYSVAKDCSIVTEHDSVTETARVIPSLVQY